jgi:hypothetical protein
VFHVSQLKPYEVSELEWPGREQQHRPAPELVDGETEWAVERVLDKRTRTVEVKRQVPVEEPVRPSGSRVLRKRPPQMRTVTEEVPVVEYKLKWLGWDESAASWREASDCHCQELIDEYELRQQQRDEEEDVAVGVRKTPAVQLGVATVVEWWQSNKQTTKRRGEPTVHCSYAAVQCSESGSACGGAVQSTVAAAA